jgi:hypothetical protein
MYICFVNRLFNHFKNLSIMNELRNITSLPGKGVKLTYHNERSCLDNVVYSVIRTNKNSTTLEAVYGQSALTGLPTFRQPFNIRNADLLAGIDAGIYTIN